ncbi:MAG: hypothetical protein U1D25_06300 [Hydrogenophaga sp.]|uniref:hypothetical protein n=1 Tax=Hydrogenophaga sp. TaxID=1904254 RepID=UPI002776F7D1|nr:hypothetical protein [Hydrogenophaga sp.]MDP2419534.1 hypothetical protein [Hydrogenophaga sp.]MDZ4187701.1 hypothetical protein [Hydrogenophaga sp.]
MKTAGCFNCGVCLWAVRWKLGFSGPSALKLVGALEASGLICRLDVASERKQLLALLERVAR